MGIKIKLDEELKDELYKLCEKYSVHPGSVMNNINQKNSTYNKETDEFIEKLIERCQDDLLYKWVKDQTSEKIFEDSIAGLIFYKKKLQEI